MLRCVYTDLDGTLLGPGGSLFRDGDGNFTLLPSRGLEACHRAAVEVVLMSGRRRATVAEDARLLGQTAFVYELGAGLSVDGEDTLLTGELEPRADGTTVYDLIEQSGAPRLLLERFNGRLEYHEPWHRGREVTHLMRGLVDSEDADAVLTQNGLGHLRLVDNGAIAPKASLPDIPRPHAYHLLPRSASKAAAVARHMAARRYSREECIAVGDSLEDAGVAEHVGRFFLVANAAIETSVTGAEVTESGHGEGFYEAVVRTLAESR